VRVSIIVSQMCALFTSDLSGAFQRISVVELGRLAMNGAVSPEQPGHTEQSRNEIAAHRYCCRLANRWLRN
jgi:hypothetical protein